MLRKIFSIFDKFPLVDWVFALLVIFSVVKTAVFLYQNSYLPQPFFYEPGDIYADWFNTAYWARDPGVYDVWATIYPPLSFVFLRVFTLDRCYLVNRAYDPSAGLSARDCDWLGVSSIWGLYVIDVILIVLTFRKIDKRTATPRSICLALGWPLLDSVERGNLFLVAFLCMMLAYGPLVRAAWARWIAVGLAVNFKVYLIATVIPLLLRRQWRWVECALLSVIGVYLVTYAVFQHGTPDEIIRNLVDWASLDSVNPLDLWFSTTYKSLISLLDSDIFPIVLIIGSKSVDNLAIFLPLMLHLTQATILLAAAAVWFRPEVVPRFRVVNLGLMLALITSEAGGYSPAYFMYFIFMERSSGWLRKYALFATFLLAPSLDIPIDQTLPVVRDTYFRHSTTIATFYITLAPFVRPLIIQTIAFAIALLTIIEVWQDIRLQGWAERWRFRHDAPLLPWVRRPLQPQGGETARADNGTAKLPSPQG